jgi:hypothetical protein
MKAYFSIDKNDRGQVQLSINLGSVGYRIAGPKYDGTSKNIFRHQITKNDIDEIRDILDRCTYDD